MNTLYEGKEMTCTLNEKRGHRHASTKRIHWTSLLAALALVLQANSAGLGQTITTVAGGGGVGDGGAAIEAGLIAPKGVFVDAAGHLYIADAGNLRIRRVDSESGVITTIAGTGGNVGFSGDGGSATEARFSFPWGLVIDQHGNMYIADGQSSR